MGARGFARCRPPEPARAAGGGSSVRAMVEAFHTLPAGPGGVWVPSAGDRKAAGSAASSRSSPTYAREHFSRPPCAPVLGLSCSLRTLFEPHPLPPARWARLRPAPACASGVGGAVTKKRPSLTPPSQGAMSSIGTGYDQSTTTFSPDGRVFQVEYASKAVDGSATAVGIRCKDGVVMCVEKPKLSKMIVEGSNRRILSVDKHSGICVSGMIADARQVCLRVAHPLPPLHQHPTPRGSSRHPPSTRPSPPCRLSTKGGRRRPTSLTSMAAPSQAQCSRIGSRGTCTRTRCTGSCARTVPRS